MNDLSRRLQALAALGDPCRWAEELLGKPLTDAQKRLMTAKSGALVSDWRRTGISTGVALRILYTLSLEPRAWILAVAPSGAMLKELFGYIRELMPPELEERLVRNSQTPQHLMFESGGGVRGASTDLALRGQGATHVFVDAVGFVKPEVLQALRPIYGTNGAFVLFADTDE